MRKIHTPWILGHELCMYVCTCMCVCGGGGGGAERGLDATPSGFCKWGQKGLDATPSGFGNFRKEIYSILLKLEAAVPSLLADILNCQIFAKFDILNIILLVSLHEITKSKHFCIYILTFKLSGLILH